MESEIFKGISPYLNTELSFSLMEVIFPSCSVRRAVLRCSFSNIVHEQFLKHPPDGTFLPEIRFQVVEIQTVFSPHRQALESNAYSGYG